MSQQINLLLPELRPRFDWLALPVVAMAAVAGLVLLLMLAEFQSLRGSQLKSEEAEINGQLLNLQQQVQAVSQSLLSRKPSETLPQEIAAVKAAVDQRREVLAFVGQAGMDPSSGFSSVLEGFARQSVDGVWLVGFGLAPKGIEIRGRLLDSSLLPTYIDRLNSDTAFQGRRFSALEMKGVIPVIEARAGVQAVTTNVVPTPGRPYTEFVLRTEALLTTERAP